MEEVEEVEEEDEDEEVEEEKDKDVEEDEDEDDGKEHQTIRQGEVVNISSENVDTMVANQPIVLSDLG